MIATIDFETTGLKAGEDEVLQVSIIDENYNVLLNAYCRPNNKDSWEDAQAVHGITPLMVANELPFERYVPTVLDILNKADKVIAYNAAFEDSYLKAYGIEVDTEKWIDPMIMFAEIYGEWNERKGSYKWQSLTKCATYYGYEFKAHDSLEDVKATLYAYKKMCKKEILRETPIKSGEQNPERNITHYTFTKSEKGAVVNMQQAVFTAHCPYELGDIVEVAIIEGMAITGYPRRLGTAEMQITDIITEHSLKNGTVSFIYELDGKKRMQLIPWNELTKRSKKH